MEQHDSTLLRQEDGFSLIELILYMGLLGILMTMVFSTFIPVLQTSSRQWRVGETQIETGVGLNLLRSDLENAGFGLPWEFPPGVTPTPYSEPTPLPDAPNVPRALNGQNNSGVNGSDRLVIRGLNVALGAPSQKWGWLSRDASHAISNLSIQSLSADSLAGTDWVIVIRPAINPGEYRRLILDVAGGYSARPTTAGLTPFAPPPTPEDPNGERYLLYGIDNGSPNRPFNRTDYYISNANVSAHCAPGTGTLLKATLNSSDNGFTTFLPIVDCVADFQVVYYLDTDGGGGNTMAEADGLNGLTAQQIRDQVKSVRCYVLTHEGGVDRTFTYPNPTINVGPLNDSGDTLLAGNSFNLNGNIGPTWANYRWKVYSLAVTPKNLQ